MAGVRYKEEKIAEALRQCSGMVYVAARKLGCSPNTILARLEKSATLREVLEEASGYMADTAELKLASAIMAGDVGAIKYYLSTKGRSRGYIETNRHEIGGINGEAIKHEVTKFEQAAQKIYGDNEE